MFRHARKDNVQSSLFSRGVWSIMRRASRLIHDRASMPGLALIPFSVISYGLISFTNVPPHHFSDRDCTGCHTVVPHEGDKRPYRFAAPVDSLCTGCHTGLLAVSHVVDVVPDISVPKGLPLDTRGNITCYTCHDPHSPATDQATGKKTHMLRDALAGKDPCFVCHEGSRSTRHLFTHRSTMLCAHWVQNRSLFKNHSGGPTCVYGAPGTLDSLSMECLTCHDTTGWSENTQCSMIFTHGRESGTRHPIGIEYDRAAYRNKGLRTVIMDSRIRLFDGKIGCCTCHDPYQPGGGLGLRAGGKKGDYKKLCQSCHLSYPPPSPIK